jgi:hypothetical protein
MLVTLLVCACSKSASPLAVADVYLQCKGDISILKTSGPQILDMQEIAVHLKDGKINFSGNGFLLGENIQICTPLTDQLYFDSESCKGESRKDKKRNYGTYNKITGVLDLTNQISENNVTLITGRFKCTKTKPLMN